MSDAASSISTNGTWARLSQALTTKRLEIFILLALPIFISILDTSWLYTGSAIDSWAYFGHFLSPRYLIQNIPFYPASRFGILIPGIVANKLFPVLVANALMRFGFYYLAVFSLYGTLRIVFHHRLAFVTAIFMGSYFPFLSAVGWNYVDGVGVAYMLASTFFITLATKDKITLSLKGEAKRLSWTLLASSSGMAMVHCNIALVTFAPLLLAYFLAMTYRQARHLSWLKIGLVIFLSAFPVVAGPLAVTGVMGLASLYLGGKFLFYKTSVEYAEFFYNTDEIQVWRDTSATWFLNRPFLALIIATFLAGVPLLIYRIRSWTFEFFSKETILSGYFWGAFLMYVGLYLFSSLYLLQISYYVTFLIPAIFMGFAVILDKVLPGSGLEQVKLRWFLLAIVILNLGHLTPLWRDMSLLLSDQAALLLPLALLLAAFGAAFYSRSALVSVLVIALAVSFANYRAISREANQTHLINDFYQGDHTAALMQVVGESVRLMRAHSNNDYVWVWLNEDESAAHRPIAASFMYFFSLIGTHFPEIMPHITFQPDMYIVLVGREEDAMLDTANAVLAERSFVLEQSHQQTVRHGDLAVHLIFTRARQM